MLCSPPVRAQSSETPGWPVAPGTKRRCCLPQEPWDNSPGPLKDDKRFVIFTIIQRIKQRHLFVPMNLNVN